MSGLYLKTLAGFVPADPDSQVAFNRVKTGQIVEAKFVVKRNNQRWSRLFALLNMAYDYWKSDLPKEAVPCDFEQFREQVLIASGWYEISQGIKGRIAKAKSLNQVDAREEEAFYQRVFQTCWDISLSSAGLSRIELEDRVAVLQGMGFAQKPT